MKNVFYVIMVFLYFLGVLGGIGYSMYNKAYIIAVGVAALGYMAFPKVKEYLKPLIY